MSDRTNMIYLYDGSFDGLLCCVFESYINHEVPIDIFVDEVPQLSLYPTKIIETDIQNAQRVYASILAKMGKDAEHLIKVGFLCGLNEKSLVIYNFIRLGYKYGYRISDMITEPAVWALHSMVRAVENEKHLLLGFVRFSEYNGGLVSVIEPKHFVLPLMKGHFCARYSGEQFMIYDKTHQMALIYHPYEAKIINIESLELPCEDEVEERYRKLWTQYYNTIAIKERENPKCRMNHMPKRFWTHLTEMNTTISNQKLIE